MLRDQFKKGLRKVKAKGQSYGGDNIIINSAIANGEFQMRFLIWYGLGKRECICRLKKRDACAIIQNLLYENCIEFGREYYLEFAWLIAISLQENQLVAKATCSDKDSFDMETGLMLAYDRLMNKLWKAIVNFGVDMEIVSGEMKAAGYGAIDDCARRWSDDDEDDYEAFESKADGYATDRDNDSD